VSVACLLRSVKGVWQTCGHWQRKWCGLWEFILLFLFTSLSLYSSCLGARCELFFGMVSRCTCRRFSVGRRCSAGQTTCIRVTGMGICTLSCQQDSVPSVGGALAGRSAT